MLKIEFILPVEENLRSIKRQLPKKLEKVESWIKGLVNVEKKQTIQPNKKKKAITRAISTIQGYFKTEPEVSDEQSASLHVLYYLIQESVDEVKNKGKPLAEEMKDLHSALSQELRSSVSQKVKDLHSSVTSVSQEVKDLHSAVSQEVKDLRSSMDQLLAIVKSMNERQGGGGGGVEAGGGGGGVEEAGGGVEEAGGGIEEQ